MTDGTDEQTVGNFTMILSREFTSFFSPSLPGNFNRVSARNVMDGKDDILPGGMTDKSDDVQVDGNFPESWTIGYFPCLIALGIFTINSADGRTDRMDD